MALLIQNVRRLRIECQGRVNQLSQKCFRERERIFLFKQIRNEDIFLV